jgi:hypothetical protein
MPIWLRNFKFSKIKEHHDKKNSQNQNDNIAKSIQTIKKANADKTITPPTYVTKAKRAPQK